MRVADYLDLWYERQMSGASELFRGSKKPSWQLNDWSERYDTDNLVRLHELPTHKFVIRALC